MAQGEVQLALADFEALFQFLEWRKSMEILPHAGVERHDFWDLVNQFRSGIVALARRADLDNDEVIHEAWLAWQAATSAPGRGVGWWWAAVEKTVLKQSHWWTGGPMWAGGEPARLVPLEAAEFEVADEAEIERWRGAEGDAFVISDTKEIAARLGISRRRAQQKVAAAVQAAAGRQPSLFKLEA